MKKLAIIISAAISICALPAVSGCKKDDTTALSRYVISAEYDDETRSLCGEEEFTFYNSTENEISALKFNLWGNAYRQNARYRPASLTDKNAYYGGASYGEESVQEVSGCAGWEVCGEDENILCVTLASAVYPEETATIKISFTLTLAEINHRTGATASTVNLGNFYPILCAYAREGFSENPYFSVGDPFVSECADYTVTLSLPNGFTAATSGRETARKVGEETTAITYELASARDFAAVLSESFKTETTNADGCELTAYYVGDNAPLKEIEAAKKSLQYFAKAFGEYAYPTLSVVFTPLSCGGMEYPALTMINSALDEEDAIYTVVHENAHQWWYAAVGSDQVNSAWQDEGLAEYSTLAFFENNADYGFTRTSLLGSAIKAYRAYYSVYNQIFSETDTSMERGLDSFAGEYEYVNIAYNKGLLLFEAARGAMGDKKFFVAIRSYYSANKFKIATAENLISHFAAASDVEGIFASYLNGKVII